MPTPSLCVALTIPAVTVQSRPRGDPIATTHSPTRGESESPNLATRGLARAVDLEDGNVGETVGANEPAWALGAIIEMHGDGVSVHAHHALSHAAGTPGIAAFLGTSYTRAMKKEAGVGERTVDPSLLNTILEKQEKLHHIRDLNTLLDNLLYETRALTEADAGSIFLVAGKKLQFSYVQNDSLFKSDFLSNKYIYTNNEIDIDERSIAGYVASTGKSLLIDDAYAIDTTYPFSFNPYFDQISSYRTVSMLIVPIRTSGKNDMVGVLELINRRDGAGSPIPFTEDQKFYITQFAFYAGIAIERALLLRDVVFKMVRTTELRDPEETRPHVSRVGSYAVELYQKWAERHAVPREQVSNFKDILKISSMLHDIGKVGVSDAILKKRQDLTREEFEAVKFHTVYGAQFFDNPTSEWDTLAYEVALNHHERWDGSGYPGVLKDIHEKTLKFGPGKKGTSIPLSARIVTLADVYDALICKRAYKDAWEEDRVLFYIKEQSGRQFDPELVSLFFEIYDIIRAIREKWA